MVVLQNLLSTVSMKTHQQDSWLCDYVVDGSFSMRRLRAILDDKLAEHSLIPTIRQRLLPQKVNVFLWRARRDFLPCYLQLAMRRLNVPSLLCPLCSVDCQSTKYALLRCTVLAKV